MITPIEGTPINELQTNFPEYRINVVTQRNVANEKESKGNFQQSLENFSNFVNDVQKKETETNKNQKLVDLDKIARRLKEILNDENLMIEFTKDDITNKLIFKLINAQTKEVIQQIPPEVALRIARYVASTLEDQNVANARI